MSDLEQLLREAAEYVIGEDHVQAEPGRLGDRLLRAADEAGAWQIPPDIILQCYELCTQLGISRGDAANTEQIQPTTVLRVIRIALNRLDPDPAKSLLEASRRDRERFRALPPEEQKAEAIRRLQESGLLDQDGNPTYIDDEEVR